MTRDQIPMGLGVAEVAHELTNIVGIDLRALFQVTGPILIALITGYFTWRVGARNASNAASAQVQTGFQMLIKELQTENIKLIERLERQSDKMDVQVRKIADLESEMRVMSKHIDRLERALSDAGVDVPAFANR